MGDAGDRPATAGLAYEISNRIGRLLSEHTGHGAHRIRTYVHDDLVVAVLHDSLSKGERRLAGSGEAANVLATRRSYHRMMREEMSTMIEDLTGRRVVAALSDHVTDPDVALEGFVLAPAEER